MRLQYAMLSEPHLIPHCIPHYLIPLDVLGATLEYSLFLSLSSLKTTFSNCKGYPWNNALLLGFQHINIIGGSQACT